MPESVPNNYFEVSILGSLQVEGAVKMASLKLNEYREPYSIACVIKVLRVRLKRARNEFQLEVQNKAQGLAKWPSGY